MVAILACPLDRNDTFELADTIYRHGEIHIVADEITEFIQLVCLRCRCIIKIEKKAVRREGSNWIYV